MFDSLNSASDPQAAFAALPDADRAAFEDYFIPASYEETVRLTPLNAAARLAMRIEGVNSTYPSAGEAQRAVAAASACYGVYVKLTAHAPAGNAIWDIFTEGSWCGNGKSATSATFSRSWSSIAAIGWRDGGQIGKGAGVSGGEARIWAQRKMILGAGGWDIQTMQPCGRLIGKGNGQHSSDKVCSVY